MGLFCDHNRLAVEVGKKPVSHFILVKSLYLVGTIDSNFYVLYNGHPLSVFIFLIAGFAPTKPNPSSRTIDQKAFPDDSG